MEKPIEVCLDNSQDILESIREEVAKRFANRLAVFIVEGIIFGGLDELGTLMKMEDIPERFNNADDITVTIVLADQKEPVVLREFYR